MTPTLLCKVPSRAYTIDAATPTDIDVPIDHAHHWTVVLKNTGANPVTALKASVSPLGTDFEAKTDITTGIPLAAGASLAAIRGVSEPVKTLRLTVTSTLGTIVTVEAAGR